MKARLLAALLVSALALVALIGVDGAACMAHQCATDDAGARALVVFNPYLMLAFLVLSWLTVFPLMLLLRRTRMPVAAILAVVALPPALLFAYMLYDPTVDTSFLQTALVVTPPLVISWLIAGWILLARWPRRAVAP